MQALNVVITEEEITPYIGVCIKLKKGLFRLFRLECVYRRYHNNKTQIRDGLVSSVCEHFCKQFY